MKLGPDQCMQTTLQYCEENKKKMRGVVNLDFYQRHSLERPSLLLKTNEWKVFRYQVIN